jgi:hypothetical protein
MAPSASAGSGACDAATTAWAKWFTGV